MYCSMSSSDAELGGVFRCPACRAKQPMQTVCRRCQTDLTLLVQASTHLENLVSQYEQANSRDDQKTMDQLEREIEFLSPKRLQFGPSPTRPRRG